MAKVWVTPRSITFQSSSDIAPMQILLSRCLPIVAFLLVSCNSDDRALTARDSDCPTIKICYSDISSPSPVSLDVMPTPIRRGAELESYLSYDFSGDMVIYNVGPQKEIGRNEHMGGKRVPRQLYYVSKHSKSKIGSIWVVFDHLNGERAGTQVLDNAFDRSTMAIKTQGDRYSNVLNLDEIALVDRATQVGPTFVSNDPQGRYIRHDYGSNYARRMFDSTSSCRQELVPAPKAWVDEATARRRICDKRRLLGMTKPWYRRLIKF
jgi:hypothetical protein